MSAHVCVTHYGQRTTVRCDACDLTEHHTRHKPAAASAQAHNDLEHRSPE